MAWKLSRLALVAVSRRVLPATCLAAFSWHNLIPGEWLKVVGEAVQYAKASKESILIQRDIENASFEHQVASRTGY